MDYIKYGVESRRILTMHLLSTIIKVFPISLLKFIISYLRLEIVSISLSRSAYSYSLLLIQTFSEYLTYLTFLVIDSKFEFILSFLISTVVSSL